VAHVRWFVEGVSFGVCNCAYGCPCQFEALPTEGHCRGFEVVRIDRGSFGDISLDGMQAALLYAWPGPIFRGGGSMQAIVDDRADALRRDALVKILHGKETNEAATHWWVYHAMSSTVHPTLFAKISFDFDLEARRANVVIPGILEASGSPIKSPATGQEHRARINIPNGIEFEVAEIGSGTIQSSGAISLDIRDRYGQFNVLRHSTDGVAR
jgi:hypothetical protein